MSGDEAVYGRLAPGYVVAERYRLKDLIGKGGSGLIYKAEDLKSGHGVAVKTLNMDLLSHPSAVTRYHREARAAAGIGHPNICAVLDVGQLPDGRPFLVMELLTGMTLADRIREDGALPFPQVISILTQTLSALEAAHAAKILHRDIKPDNVFLTDRIRSVLAVKLLDFGIAKSLDENAELSLTRTGMVVGTPFYMAPEQARGETLDHRVDLYACGVLLYEMLTGHRPFHATNYNALMLQVLTMPPPDPRHLRPATPSEFVDILDKAMAKDRQDRYPDARSFLATLWTIQGNAVQHPNPSGNPSHDSMDAEDIPVFHESEPPPPTALGLVQNADNEAVTQPFVRPAQLRPLKRPSSPFRRTQPSVEATEVMMDAPWLLENNEEDVESPVEDIAVQAAQAASPPISEREEPPSWDDEPTKVDSRPSIPEPPPSKPALTKPALAKPAPAKPVPSKPLPDNLRAPSRVPRPQRKK